MFADVKLVTSKGTDEILCLIEGKHQVLKTVTG